MEKEGFEKLEVWQKARAFSVDLYKITKSFPDDERFSLTQQLRRAAISIVSNLAEGSAKGSGKEFVRFIRIALGSTAEIKAQLILSKDLGYLSEENYVKLYDEISIIGRMLKALEKAIINKEKKND